MRIVLIFIRFLIAWLYALGAGAVALTLGIPFPEFAWLTVCKPWAKGTLWLIGIHLDVEGREKLQGAAVYVCNHQSLVDVVFVPAILPRTVRFVAKKELERIPLWGWAFGRIGAVLIDRKDPRGALESIREGVARLPEGWSIAVFPEGTRSVDGALGRFKKGAFHIAMQAGLPIVPFGLHGARDVVPKNAWLARPARVFVTVGELIPTDQWSLATMSEHITEVRDAVQQCVDRSKERYADWKL